MTRTQYREGVEAALTNVESTSDKEFRAATTNLLRLLAKEVLDEAATASSHFF